MVAGEGSSWWEQWGQDQLTGGRAVRGGASGWVVHVGSALCWLNLLVAVTFPVELGSLAPQATEVGVLCVAGLPLLAEHSGHW